VFRFRDADATTPREASFKAFRFGDSLLNSVTSDALGFRPTEVLWIDQPTPPVFIAAGTSHPSFRGLVLHRSQAEKAVTVPTRPSYSLGDLGKAAKDLAVPSEALVKHHHPFQSAFPFANEHRSRVEANPVARPWLALLKGTAGGIDRIAFRSANNAHSRIVEIAKRGRLKPIG
jgi:hypothetical protein